MQLTLPDCCFGDFCPGKHTEGHDKKDDGTYYSNDDHQSNAYHYHNTDGSVFYRYSDGSEYYRHRNGNIRFRPPEDPPEKVEGADPTPTSALITEEQPKRPWYDWPPRLTLSIRTDGTTISILDKSGLMVTFEPDWSNTEVKPAPVRDSLPPEHMGSGRSGSKASQGMTFRVQEWSREKALTDIASPSQV